MFEKYQLEKPDNLVELFENSVKKYADRAYLGAKNKQGEYEWVTYREIGRRVDNLRGGLASLGVKRGDAVGIICNNSIDWAVGHFATVGLGAFYVPMYEAELTHVWEYIIKDSAIKVLFVSKPEIYEKSQGLSRHGFPPWRRSIVMQGEGKYTMAELERIGEKKPVKAIYPKPEEVAVLIYTSGTTGDPKGVLLMHGNWTSNHHARMVAYPDLNSEDRIACPFCPGPTASASGNCIPLRPSAAPWVSWRAWHRCRGHGQGEADLPDRRPPHLQQGL